MSNPYDPYAGSGDQTPPPPYGEPIQSGGGGSYPPSPYGSAPGGYGAPAPRTDGLSITAFVLSLTCVLSVVGLILGFVGLGRTKNNQRKGRWAAIAAIPIGIIGTLALAGVIIAVVFVVKNSITPDNAEVGQCANISTEDKDTISFLKKDCSSEHDVEVVYVGKLADAESLEFAPTNPDDFTDRGASLLICGQLIGDEAATALGDEISYGFVVTQSDDPQPSDAIFCYAENTNGDKLTSKLNY